MRYRENIFYIEKEKFLYIIKYVLLIGMLGFLLTACGNSVKSVKDMRNDLNNSTLVTEYCNEGEQKYEIKELEVIKRNTQETIDDVYVAFRMNNGINEIAGELQLVYNYYTTGGWILDDIYAISEFVFLPLSGQDENYAIEEMYYCGYEVCTLIEHKTDLENMKDCFVFDVSCDTALYSMSGTLNLIYVYDSSLGVWMYAGIEQNDDYIIEWNPATFVLEKYSGNLEVIGFRILYYFECVEGNILYGKRFTVDDSAAYVDSWTSKAWSDVEWWIDFETKTITDMSTNQILRFDTDNIYSQVWSVYTKISDGCVDPKIYADSIGYRYDGPDIGGAPLINNN